jgi:hypothetical protein
MLTLSGAGISNNSGIQQNFNVGDFNTLGHIRFRNSASAGNARINIGDQVMGVSSTVDFSNHSTGGSADIENFQASINFLITPLQDHDLL